MYFELAFLKFNIVLGTWVYSSIVARMFVLPFKPFRKQILIQYRSTCTCLFYVLYSFQDPLWSSSIVFKSRCSLVAHLL